MSRQTQFAARYGDSAAFCFGFGYGTHNAEQARQVFAPASEQDFPAS